jgi:hypothetical protein
MRIFRSVFAIGVIASIVLSGRSAAAEGWHCMMLNQTEQQAMDFSIHIPVYDAPSPSAQVAGYASASLVVADQAPVGGFMMMRFPNGKNVWIAEANVKQWHALANPTAKCAAYIKPNGKPGFKYQ